MTSAADHTFKPKQNCYQIIRRHLQIYFVERMNAYCDQCFTGVYSKEQTPVKHWSQYVQLIEQIIAGSVMDWRQAGTWINPLTLICVTRPRWGYLSSQEPPWWQNFRRYQARTSYHWLLNGNWVWSIFPNWQQALKGKLIWCISSPSGVTVRWSRESRVWDVILGFRIATGRDRIRIIYSRFYYKKI